MYPAITVPAEAGDILEQIGTKPKFWFSDELSNRWLFKLNRSEGQNRTGEDWGEKVACELSQLIGLPHAQYEFAVWKGQDGVVSLSFVPPSGRLVAGNEVLVSLDKNYPKERFYRVRQHTLRLVLKLIGYRDIRPPMGWIECAGIQSAVEVCVGYLLFDAWIANQDRHHENWGFVVSPERIVHLAPSFDHASCLGWNETDETRLERLTTRDSRRAMNRYVERALSAFFSSSNTSKPMTTLDVFKEAARLQPAAAKAWLDRLRQINQNVIYDIFDQIPAGRQSAVGKQFAAKMLELNQNRLLNLTV
jgi:hypothetical protein